MRLWFDTLKESTYLDHHVEIHHDALRPSAGYHGTTREDNRTVGTGMLRISDGSRG